MYLLVFIGESSAPKDQQGCIGCATPALSRLQVLQPLRRPRTH
jgi:hypothetical protein